MRASREASRENGASGIEAPFSAHCIDAGLVIERRLFRDIDILTVDHFEDCGLAGAVAHLVHSDLTRDAWEAF